VIPKRPTLVLGVESAAHLALRVHDLHLKLCILRQNQVPGNVTTLQIGMVPLPQCGEGNPNAAPGVGAWRPVTRYVEVEVEGVGGTW
jgi:hypothetical protein